MSAATDTEYRALCRAVRAAPKVVHLRRAVELLNPPPTEAPK